MEKRTIILGTYDTALTGLWTLAGLELSSPSVQTYFVDVPGRKDGPLDLSTVLTDGEPTYSSRSLKVKLENSDGTRLERENRIREMIAELDGYRLPIWLPDNPDYYLEGRVHVVREYNDLAHAAVTVTATCAPWLYRNEETVYTLTASANAQKATIVNRGRRTVAPVLEATGTVTLVFGEYTWTLDAGTYKMADFAPAPGQHELTYSGTGTIKITYREAVLL